MTVIEHPAPASETRAVSGANVLALYTATLFLSAFLLFSVQPFFAKMALPRLGGSPAVWSVAMVFFQGALLAGYGYAHLLTARLSLKTAVLAHLAVMAIGLLALPIGISAAWDNPPESGQALWLLALFAASVGLPFFAVSANGPLLQAWFARTGHAHAGDPYFLYGASNIGSFASLFLYILFFEPLFTVSGQSWMWTAGYVALGLAIAACGFVALRQGGATMAQDVADAQTTASPTWTDRLTWVALAFVPSGLLVAVTAHISTDLAAAPFLWVMPLALFLLTFVIVFQRKPLIRAEWMQAALPPMAIVVIAALTIGGKLPVWLSLAAHYGYFFIAAMAAHGVLAARRPAARHLTEFYFAMSIGGVLGGIFTSLVAPAVFTSIAEYPILVVASLLVLPPVWRSGLRPVLHALIAALAIGLYLPELSSLVTGAEWKKAQYAINAGAVALVAMALYARRPQLSVMLFAIGVTLVGGATATLDRPEVRRSFFGVTAIINDADGQFRRMVHGTTLHGAMRIADANGNPATGAPEPLTYYHANSGMALSIIETRKRLGGQIGRAGVVGLGAGSLACYRQPGETFDYYEIDRDVVELAQNPAHFRFMPECAADSRVIVGDARLKLRDEPDDAYDLLVIDAFSSDSIPVHLITVEALAMYERKLSKDGLLVMHISNRHMELESVIAANAGRLGLTALFGDFPADFTMNEKTLKERAFVAFLARDPVSFGALAQDGRVRPAQANGVAPWTDDYSNVLGAIWRNYAK